MPTGRKKKYEKMEQRTENNKECPNRFEIQIKLFSHKNTMNVKFQ